MSDIIHIALGSEGLPPAVKVDGICYELIREVPARDRELSIADDSFGDCLECEISLLGASSSSGSSSESSS